MHKFTKKEKEFIKQHAFGRSNKDLTEMFNKHFETDLKVSQVKAFKKNNKIPSGLTGHFPKGNIPFNKGMKGVNFGGKETQFRIGHRPANWRPVGSERTTVDGYIEIKTEEPNIWRQKHKVIWTEAYGPIPEGYAIIFADANKSNLDLDNLILVSRQELLALNRNELIKEDPEATKIGVMIARINCKIANIQKGREVNDKNNL